jgi:hypothetical protein
MPWPRFVILIHCLFTVLGIYHAYKLQWPDSTVVGGPWSPVDKKHGVNLKDYNANNVMVCADTAADHTHILAHPTRHLTLRHCQKGWALVVSGV